MGLLDRTGILVKSNIREMIEAEDPEKILDRSVNDMQEGVARLHQNLAQSMADLNLHEQQYNQSVTQAQEWEKRAILAIQNGDENLAREALSCNETHADSAATLKAGLDHNLRRIEVLKKVIELETKLVQLRQTLEQSMATLKLKEAEYNQCTLQLQEWDRRSLLALQNGDENLVNENLRQKENYGSLAETLKSELDLQLMQIDTLKKDLIAIKRKINEVTACPIPVSRKKYEVAPELAAIRAKMMTSSPEPEGALPPSDAARKPSVEEAIDAELAAIKAKIMESCSSEN